MEGLLLRSHGSYENSLPHTARNVKIHERKATRFSVT